MWTYLIPLVTKPRVLWLCNSLSSTFAVNLEPVQWRISKPAFPIRVHGPWIWHQSHEGPRASGREPLLPGSLAFFPSPLPSVFVCFWSPFVSYLPFPSLLFSLFFIFISLVASQSIWVLSSPNRAWTHGLPRWKCRVLTAGLSGKSQLPSFLSLHLSLASFPPPSSLFLLSLLQCHPIFPHLLGRFLPGSSPWIHAKYLPGRGAPFATPREINSHPRLRHIDQMSGKILHLKISPWMFLKQMDDCIQEYPFPRTFSVCRRASVVFVN